MLISFVRTLIMYVAVAVSLRFLGKRQIGQTQASELVVAILISEFASLPLVDTNTPLIAGVFPIIALIICEILLSLFCMKFPVARRIIAGRPSVLIENGVINIEEMERLRLDIDDLLEELRGKDVFDIKDVHTAVLENNGQLSVLHKSDSRPLEPTDINLSPPQPKMPHTLISDGIVDRNGLKAAGKSIAWLTHRLKEHGVQSHEEVFLASLSGDGSLFVQMKEKKS